MIDDGVQHGLADGGRQSDSQQALHQKRGMDRADAVRSKLLELQSGDKRALVVMVSHEGFLYDLSVKILRSTEPLQGVYGNGDGVFYVLGVDKAHADPANETRLQGLYARRMSPRSDW